MAAERDFWGKGLFWGGGLGMMGAMPLCSANRQQYLRLSFPFEHVTRKVALPGTSFVSDVFSNLVKP